MAFYDKFPYTNFQELNLDKIVNKIGDIDRAEKATAESAAAAKASENNARNSQQEAAASALSASQSANASADSAEASAASAGESAQYLNEIGTHTAGVVSDWLTEHITNPTNPPLDTSLLISGAAADAKATGDAITNFKNELRRTETFTPNLIGTEGNVLYPVELKAGDVVTVATSDGSVFGSYGDADLQIRFYDNNRNQVSYYTMFANLRKRTITLGDSIPQIGFIGASATPRVPLMANIGDTAQPYVSYVTPLKNVIADNYKDLVRRASQYFAYFATGSDPSILKQGTSVTISQTANDFRIYSRTGAIKASGLLGTWTIAPFKMLVYDLDTKNISVEDFGTEGNWVLLFSNNYGVYDGILSPFYNQEADFTEKTFIVGAGTFHSSSKDQLKCMALAGQDIFITADVFSERTDMEIYLAYADGTLSRGYFYSIDKNMFGLYHLDKDLAAIGVAYDNTNGNSDVLIRFTAVPKIKGDFSTLNDIVSLSKIPYSQDKVKEFSANYKVTSNSDSFIFFSDPHTMNNESKMDTRLLAIASENMAEVKKYADEICPDAIISGGDWLNNGDTKDAACYKLRLVKGICRKYFGSYNFHNLFGNHDTNYQGIEQEGSAENTGRIDQNIINNILYTDEDTQKSYYSFKTNRTKYYCFDTGIDWDTAITAYQQEQINWFAQALLNENDAHIVVAMHIFSHVTAEADFGSDNRPMATTIVSIIKAFNNRSNITVNGTNYNYSAKTGTVHCILTGHTHFDKIYIADDNLPVVCITDATDYSQSKTKFDLGMLDYENRKLYLVRINEDVSQRTVNLR